MVQQLDGSENLRGRGRGFAQIALILVVVAIALYYAQAPDRLEFDDALDLVETRAMPAVSVVQPKTTEQALTVRLTGAVSLDDKVSVMSEVTGRVVEVSPNFENGGSLAANETIVRIDPARYALQVEAAEMSVRAAQARVEIERARGLEQAQSFVRDHPGVAVSEWVRRLPHLERAQAKLMKAQAALKLAQLELAQTEISLPYAARVISADVSVGELIGPPEQVGSGAAVLGGVYRVEGLQVDAPIEPKDLKYLDPVIGRSARIHSGDGTYDAEIVRVSAVVARKTRLANLFLDFSGDVFRDSLPVPGTFVEVEIAGPAYGDVYVLPESVMQEQDSVWVIRGGALNAFVPRVLGRTAEGVVVEAFDVGDGVVDGMVVGAREGLKVTVAGQSVSG